MDNLFSSFIVQRRKFGGIKFEDYGYPSGEIEGVLLLNQAVEGEKRKRYQGTYRLVKVTTEVLGRG